MSKDRKLQWGYNKAVPEAATAAWGARLILTRDGGDLLPDRQDIFYDNDDVKKRLADRLNKAKPWGEPLKALIRKQEVRQDVPNEIVVYEDDAIKVVGNSNGSYGYFYIAGWLK
jgi:hypothetical protein